MAKKIRYYYDEDSCTFYPEQPSAKAIFVNVSTYVGGSLLLAVLMLAAYFFLYDNPKEAYLKQQQKELIAHIEQLEGQFAMLEGEVNQLHAQDNSFYRSLLNQEKVSPSEWESGVGGSAYSEAANDPDVLRDVEERLNRLYSKIDIQSQSYDVLFKELKEKGEELRHMPAIRPVEGRIISGFGMRMHPILRYKRMHTGLDMQASTGTPVYATADGVVRLARMARGGYGRQIEIEHGSTGFVSKYAHLSKIKVKQGHKVKRGDLIAFSGNTGMSSGPHLHYEIIKSGQKIDPINYFYGEITPEEYVNLRKQATAENNSMD
jgi:murein DD-endopeptidase MepM/ murein hydrolase activator NlpD